MIAPQRNPLPRPAAARTAPMPVTSPQQRPMRVLQTGSAPAQLSLFLRPGAAFVGAK